MFRHESGIHVHGLLRTAATYEPFAAEAVGRAGTEIVLGKHFRRGGRAAHPGPAGTRRFARQAKRLAGELRLGATCGKLSVVPFKAGMYTLTSIDKKT